MDPKVRAQYLLDYFCHQQDRARIGSIIKAQKSTKTGVCWIQKHFKRVESNIGFRLGQLADLFLHTEGRSASISEIEQWLGELGISAVSSFKEGRNHAKTPLVCKTHRHVTVMLPRDYTPVCHPLTEGSLTADKLRDILVRKQLILSEQASKMEFIDPWKDVPGKVLNEVHKDVDQVRVKQELKQVYLLKT
jgi:hypothetical protein